MYLTTTYYICKQGISEIHEIQIEFQSLLVSEFKTTRLGTSNIVYVMQRSRYEPEMTTRTYSCSLTFFLCCVSPQIIFASSAKLEVVYSDHAARHFLGSTKGSQPKRCHLLCFYDPLCIFYFGYIGIYLGSQYISFLFLYVTTMQNYIETLGNPQNCITISYSPFLKQIKLLILTQDKRTTELPRKESTQILSNTLLNTTYTIKF